MKFYFFVVLFILYYDSYAQDTIKMKRVFDVELYQISKKELNHLLDGVHITEELDANLIHHLRDGRVIYEMPDVVNYLFSNKKNFDQFIMRAEEPEPEGDLLFIYTHPVNDSLFIDKVNDYISLLFEAENINVDLSTLESLKAIDTLLNQWELEKIKYYRLSVAAILGQLFINQMPNHRHWKYLSYSTKGKTVRIPIVVYNEKLIIDPVGIVDEEYNRKVLKKGYRISLYNALIERR